MLGEFPAVRDPAKDFRMLHPLNAQLDQTVGEKDAIAWPDFARKLRVVCWKQLVVSRHPARRERDERVWREFQRAAADKRPGADLRPLEVLKNRHGPATLAREAPEHPQARRVLAGGAVREVQPRHVEPGVEQRAEHQRPIGCRAECRDNLGAALCSHSGLQPIGGHAREL